MKGHNCKKWIPFRWCAPRDYIRSNFANVPPPSPARRWVAAVSDACAAVRAALVPALVPAFATCTHRCVSLCIIQNIPLHWSQCTRRLCLRHDEEVHADRGFFILCGAPACGSVGTARPVPASVSVTAVGRYSAEEEDGTSDSGTGTTAPSTRGGTRGSATCAVVGKYVGERGIANTIGTRGRFSGSKKNAHEGVVGGRE
jgi:hypothetical protein